MSINYGIKSKNSRKSATKHPKNEVYKSTYQTSPCLNPCLSLSNTKTKNHSQPPQDIHRQHLNGKADPKLAQKVQKSFNKQARK